MPQRVDIATHLKYLLDTGKVNVRSSDNSLSVVESIVNGETDFDVTVNVIEALAGTISINPSTLTLIGATINPTVSWDWLKVGTPVSVDTQDFDKGLGAGYESINNALRQKQVNGITKAVADFPNNLNHQFKVKGDDGLGNGASSTKELTINSQFGDYMYWGQLAIDIDKGYNIDNPATLTDNDVITLIQSLTNSPIKASRSLDIDFTENDKFGYVALASALDPNDDIEDFSKSAGFYENGEDTKGGFFLVGRFTIDNGNGANGTQEFKLYQTASDQLLDFGYTLK